MASKRRKLEDDNKHSKIQHEKERNEEVPQSEKLIYILPKKIPKARLQVLINLAQKKEFSVTEHYRLVNAILFLLLRFLHYTFIYSPFEM